MTIKDMKLQGIDKFEYKYVDLYTTFGASVTNLNILGKEGWELFELYHPKSNGDCYKALLIRRITEVEV